MCECRGVNQIGCKIGHKDRGIKWSDMRIYSTICGPQFIKADNYLIKIMKNVFDCL